MGVDRLLWRRMTPRRFGDARPSSGTAVLGGRPGRKSACAGTGDDDAVGRTAIRVVTDGGESCQVGRSAFDRREPFDGAVPATYGDLRAAVDVFVRVAPLLDGGEIV